MWVALANIFCKNVSVCAIFDDQSFNNTLTNNIVSFEQLGPGHSSSFVMSYEENIFLSKLTVKAVLAVGQASRKISSWISLQWLVF